MAPAPPLSPTVRRWQRLGVTGAVLVLLAFGLLNVLAVRPFYAGDETAHTDYGLEVGHGHLPVFDDRFPDRIPGMSDQWPTMAAVHPPLYYALVAGPLRLGVASGHPLAGLLAARALTVAIAAAAVVAVAGLAAALLPGRPAALVTSAGLMAAAPSFQQLAGFVYNDALAVGTAAAALTAIALAVRHGCDRARLVLLAVTAVLAAASRASGLELALLATLAAAAPPAASRGRPWPAQMLPAVRRMAVVAVAVGVSTGWFYGRNLRLYGDLAGTNRATQGIAPGPSVAHNALSPAFWLDQYTQLWGTVTGLDPVDGAPAVAAYAVLTAVLAGLVGLLVRALAGVPRPHRPARRGLALAWLMMGAHALLVAAIVLSYFSMGGYMFGRYFFPLLPLWPVVAAAALAALPGSHRNLPALAAILTAAGIGAAMTGTVLAAMLRRSGSQPPADLLGRITEALEAQGVPAPVLVLVGLAGLLLLGLVLVGSALVRLPGSAPPPPPAPSAVDPAPAAHPAPAAI